MLPGSTPWITPTVLSVERTWATTTPGLSAARPLPFQPQLHHECLLIAAERVFAITVPTAGPFVEKDPTPGFA